MKRSERINLRIDPELAETLRKLAEADGRTLSDYTARLLKEITDKLKQGE